MQAQLIKYLQLSRGGGGGVGVEGNSWEGYIVQMSLCLTLTWETRSVTRFYGGLSVYSHPLPSEKIAP